MGASVESRVEQVTVYATGARVRRVARVSGSETRVRLVGLPLALVDDSVRVEVVGPAMATSARVVVDAPEAPPIDHEPADVGRRGLARSSPTATSSASTR